MNFSTPGSLGWRQIVRSSGFPWEPALGREDRRASMPEPLWDDVETIFVQAPACPNCGNISPHQIIRSQREEYGIVRKAVCRRCSNRFKIVVEFLPAAGSDDF